MAQKRKAMWLWEFKLNTNRKKKQKLQDKNLTRFDDLPDEILLMICHYLSPKHVLNAFYSYNKRLFSCTFKYRDYINLTNCSYADMTFFLSLLIKNNIQSSILTISNSRMPIQIETFLNRCYGSTGFHPNNVHHLSLLDYKFENIYSLSSCVKKFKLLKSLHIVQATSNTKNNSSINYTNIQELRNLIFNNSWSILTELELNIDDGIILDKQLIPNKYLTKLTISLYNINDLCVLFDGLLPNLIILNVILCQSNPYKQSSLPISLSYKTVSRLVEFKLITYENVEFTFDQLQNIVKPLYQIQKLTLYIKEWINNDQRIIDGNQLKILFDQFMPQLYHFRCSIHTQDDIDMKTFEQWPMKYHLKAINSYKHLYTVPWSFEYLYTSMLANDDIISICPNVQYLTVGIPYKSLSERFPNIHTLTIQTEGEGVQNNYSGFRRLRHLTMNNINIVPSSVIKHLYTLTLFEINQLLTHPIIYSNIRYLKIKNNKISSLSIIKSIIEHFPNVYSLEIELELNTEYYSNLNMLLDNKYLPYLRLLKTNRIDQSIYSSNINLWLQAKTLLKWRTTPFYGQFHENDLIIYL